MDAPVTSVAPLFINSCSKYMKASEELISAGVSVVASGALGFANHCYYMPLVLPFRYNIKRWFVVNGGAVNGNFDIGLLALDGTLIASTGSVAQAGTGTIQYVTASPTLVIPPGAYILGFGTSSATAQFARHPTVPGSSGRLAGLLQQATFPLPAVWTPASFTDLVYPLCGFTSTSSGY